MMDLAFDPRSSAAYAMTRERDDRGMGTGLPPSTGAAADLLLQSLAATEAISWLGWAHPATDGPPSWSMVALTEHRLVGVSTFPEPAAWATPAQSWTGSVDGADVLLVIREDRAPLRIRGAGPVAEMFDMGGADGTVVTEDYAQEQRAKELAQEYFDVAVDAFMKAAKLALGGRRVSASLRAAVGAETDRVSAIVDDIGSRTIPLDELTGLVDEINETTRRICARLRIPATV